MIPRVVVRLLFCVSLGALARCGGAGATTETPPTVSRDAGNAGNAGNADAGEEDPDAGIADAGAPPRDAGERDGGPPPPPVCEPVAPTQITSAAQRIGITGIVAVENGYLVAWSDQRDGPSTMYVARVDSSGARVGPERALGPEQSGRSDIVETEEGAAVLYPSLRSGLQLVHVDPTGELVGSPIGVGAFTASGGAAIARSADGYGLVYSVGVPGSPHQIWFRRLDGDGNPVGEATPLTDQDEIYAWPGIAWNGTQFGVVFSRSGSRFSQTMFLLVDEDGNIQTTTSSVPDDIRASAPTIASDGDGFLLGFDTLGENGQLRFLNANGSPVGALLPSAPRPAIVWNGEVYGVASTWFGHPLRFATVTPVGFPIVIDNDVAGESLSSFTPAIAWDGLGFAIIWNQQVSNQAGAVFFARVCL